MVDQIAVKRVFPVSKMDFEEHFGNLVKYGPSGSFQNSVSQKFNLKSPITGSHFKLSTKMVKGDSGFTGYLIAEVCPPAVFVGQNVIVQNCVRRAVELTHELIGYVFAKRGLDLPKESNLNQIYSIEKIEITRHYSMRTPGRPSQAGKSHAAIAERNIEHVRRHLILQEYKPNLVGGGPDSPPTLYCKINRGLELKIYHKASQLSQAFFTSAMKSRVAALREECDPYLRVELILNGVELRRRSLDRMNNWTKDVYQELFAEVLAATHLDRRTTGRAFPDSRQIAKRGRYRALLKAYKEGLAPEDQRVAADILPTKYSRYRNRVWDAVGIDITIPWSAFQKLPSTLNCLFGADRLYRPRSGQFRKLLLRNKQTAVLRELAKQIAEFKRSRTLPPGGTPSKSGVSDADRP